MANAQQSRYPHGVPSLNINTPEGQLYMQKAEQLRQAANQGIITTQQASQIASQLYQNPNMDISRYLASQSPSQLSCTTCGGLSRGWASVPAPQIPSAPQVTPAPAYEPTPEQKAWEEAYGQQIRQWVEAGGYGIPEETQQQIIQSITEQLKAKEQEDIRVMRNNMERRGLTNSGLLFANEQRIKANTTMALAQSIRDVKIQSALLKMASFERALASMGEFLGYLSSESTKYYQPKLATWQAQQEANMQSYLAQVQASLARYSAQVEMQKMAIAQAYERQNLLLAHQLSMQQAQQQYQWEKELTMMKIQAEENIAKYQGKGSLIGAALGLILLF